MTYPTGETIWITGASSGIGKHLAVILAQHNNRVIVTARRGDLLASLECMHPNIVALAADITGEQAQQSLSEALNLRVEKLDRVILNAGTCEYFDVATPDWGMMRRVMEVNYFGALNCLAAALPLLLKSDAGHVVAMASQASRVPFPRAQAYGASKAALTYMIESMGVDLREQNIRMTIVQLGFIDTPMTASNDFPMPFLMSAEKTAEKLILQFNTRPRLIRFPKRLSWVIGLGQRLPGVWSRYIAPKLSRA